MLFLLATLAASATTPSVVLIPEAAAPPRCRPHIIYARNEKNRGVHRLNQEPPAIAYFAVDREIGGCPIPAVMQTGTGR
jgi:hypothetical protein